jgi:hypothetical protein
MIEILRIIFNYKKAKVWAEGVLIKEKEAFHV